MSLIIYSLPGIDVPVFTLIMLAVGMAAFILFSDRVLSSLCLLFTVILGVTAALAASADLTLLSALVLFVLAVAVVFIGAPKGKKRRGR